MRSRSGNAWTVISVREYFSTFGRRFTLEIPCSTNMHDVPESARPKGRGAFPVARRRVPSLAADGHFVGETSRDQQAIPDFPERGTPGSGRAVRSGRRAPASRRNGPVRVSLPFSPQEHHGCCPLPNGNAAPFIRRSPHAVASSARPLSRRSRYPRRRRPVLVGHGVHRSARGAGAAGDRAPAGVGVGGDGQRLHAGRPDAHRRGVHRSRLGRRRQLPRRPAGPRHRLHPPGRQLHPGAEPGDRPRPHRRRRPRYRGLHPHLQQHRRHRDGARGRGPVPRRPDPPSTAPRRRGIPDPPDGPLDGRPRPDLRLTALHLPGRDARCRPPVLPRRPGQALHRRGRQLQDQHAPPAPDRRPGLAHRHRRPAQSDHRGRQHAERIHRRHLLVLHRSRVPGPGGLRQVALHDRGPRDRRPRPHQCRARLGRQPELQQPGHRALLRLRRGHQPLLPQRRAARHQRQHLPEHRDQHRGGTHPRPLHPRRR